MVVPDIIDLFVTPLVSLTVTAILDYTIICQNRELQHHLVFFRITFSPHTENILLELI